MIPNVGQRPTEARPSVSRSAMPEWLTRQDEAPEAWKIQQGQPVRGDAWTNLSEHTMRVPNGGDEMSRLVRAHEMMHAKVSPKEIHHDWVVKNGASMDAVVSAEELRVNMLVKEAGFDINELRDGSESTAGKRHAENEDWNNAVLFLAAISGTRAAADYLRGVKSVSPDMEKALRVVQKTLNKEWRKNLKRRGIKTVSSTKATEVDEREVPRGFYLVTMALARIIQSFLRNTADEYSEEGMPSAEELASGEGRGQFARLIERRLPKPVSVNGKLGRKRVATNIGRNPRRINRMLTDPEKRVFDRSAKGRGGIVVIDQSGSMHLDSDEMWKIIEAAPGCLIIGYSHRPATTAEPNVWILADRGKVVKDIPGGNKGNGVDGPALRFAAKRRKGSEPFIWVCDGIVTDGIADTAYPNLDRECAELVRQHGIHMVGDVQEAVKALQSVAHGKRLGTRYVGRIERAASRLSEAVR